MTPRLAQGKWINTLRMTRMASLHGCCCCATAAARKQMMIWGCSLLQKSWNSGFGLYSRNPEKPRELSWNGLTLICVPAAGKLSCHCCCRKSNEDLGLLPSSKKAKTLESDSTEKTQKNLERFSEMANPRKSPPWGSAQFLKDADETAAKMPMKLLLKCSWNYC